MGMYLVPDQGEPEPFASLQGLRDVRAYCEGAGMAATLHLVDAGWSDVPSQVVKEVAGCHAVGDVLHTLQSIAAVAKTAKKVLTVTDGFTK